MMRRFQMVILLGAIALISACRSADHGRMALWGGSEDLRDCCDEYKHVILVCVYEDWWERKPRPDYDCHHYKASVVQSYKGTWRPSERIALVHGVDGDNPVFPQINQEAGELMYVFTNWHEQTEISIEAGDFISYAPEIEGALTTIFPGVVKGR